MTPLCNVAHIHGRTGWKARPFTLADLLSNLVSMVDRGCMVCTYVRIGLVVVAFVFLAGARGKLHAVNINQPLTHNECMVNSMVRKVNNRSII